jgi:hypothetical protein
MLDFAYSRVLTVLMRTAREVIQCGDTESGVRGSGEPLREFLGGDMAGGCVFLVNPGTGKSLCDLSTLA